MNSPRIYLDNAATSFPKPDCVYDAVSRYLRENGAAYGRGGYAAADESARIVAQCRSRLAGIIGVACPEQIAFTFNCTDGLNLLLRGILKPGDHVVTTALEHNSVLRPLERLTSFGVTVEHVSFDPQSGIIDQDAFRKAVMSRPVRMAAINHASNVTGVVQPIEDLISVAHGVGAMVLLDVAQSAGHIPLQIDQLKIDMVAGAGHKGLLGPLGTGFVFLNEHVASELDSLRAGGTGTHSDSLIQPTEMPHLLESGNLNMPGLAGLNAGLEWVHDQLDGNVDQGSRCRRQLIEGLADIENVTLHCTDETGIGAVSISIRNLDPRDAAMMLEQSFGIACRAGFHCAPLVHQTLGTLTRGGTLRFSPGRFNTPQECQIAIDAVAAIATTV